MQFVTHKLTVRQGDPKQSCLVLFFCPSSLSLSHCLSLFSPKCPGLPHCSVFGRHRLTAVSSTWTVKMSALKCGCRMSRATSETSHREGTHCLELMLFKCIFFFFLHLTRSDTQLPLGQGKRKRISKSTAASPTDVRAHTVHRDRSLVVTRLHLPIIPKNKPSVSDAEPIGSETEALQPIGEAAWFAAVPVAKCKHLR